MTEKKKVGRPEKPVEEKKNNGKFMIYRKLSDIIQLGGFVRVRIIVNNFLDQELKKLNQ